MTLHRAWAAGAVFCWLVALWLVFMPVTIANEPLPDVECGRPIATALSGEDLACALHARDRVQHLALWLVLTAPVTLGFLTRRRPQPAE